MEPVASLLSSTGVAALNGGKTSVPAVDRALDVVEHLSANPEGLTLSQLSTALGMPKNAVFRITGTLRARGYITRSKADKRFTLTRKFLTLGQPYSGDVSLVAAASAAMRSLRDQTLETVQLGIRVDLEGVIIDKVESLQPLRIAVDVGLRFKLYNNAPGKVLLAYMPAEERQATIAQLDLQPHTPRTITDTVSLRQECERIIAQGYATDHGEADEGIHCIAAPIFDRDEHLAATIWVSAPSRRMPRDSFSTVAHNVIAASSEITRSIQH